MTKWSIYGLKEQCQMPVSLMLIQETAKNFCSEAYRPSLVEMLLTKPWSKALPVAQVQVCLRQTSGQAGSTANVVGTLSLVLEEEGRWLPAS